MSDQKIVLRLEIIFDGDGITSSKDVKSFLADWVHKVGENTINVKQVNGKAIEFSPNEKQKELIAVATYKPTYDDNGERGHGELDSMTATEKYCVDHDITREQLAKFCEKHSMKLSKDA